MNKELAIKWVEALRSGKYKQGRNRLFDSIDNSYCCLGVLAEICEYKKQDSTSGYYNFDGLLANGVFNGKELKTTGGTIPSINRLLTTMNDQGASFNEIADIIEKYYEEL